MEEEKYVDNPIEGLMAKMSWTIAFLSPFVGAESCGLYLSTRKARKCSGATYSEKENLANLCHATETWGQMY